jgi:hypothetical protein
MLCLACRKRIERGELLNCAHCKGLYHYECMGMTHAYYTENSIPLRNHWKCLSCESKTRRQRNDDTPASPAGIIKQTNAAVLDPTNMSYEDIDTSNEQSNTTIARETPNPSGSQAPSLNRTDDTGITLDSFRKLLDEKLKFNNRTIIEQLKSIIQSEVNGAVTKLHSEMIQKTDALSHEQHNLNLNIENLTCKIQALEEENTKLQADIRRIQDNATRSIDPAQSKSEGDTSKKIVVHGLEEWYGESEERIIERLAYIFHDVLEVNIDGYIEETYRVGKRGNQRPLVIELTSKRITKYILQHSHLFKYAGMNITEYLDEASLRNRRKLIEALKQARKEGKYAIIKSNVLFINGKIYTCENISESSQSQIATNTEYKTNNNNIKVPEAEIHITQETEALNHLNSTVSKSVNETFFRR